MNLEDFQNILANETKFNNYMDFHTLKEKKILRKIMENIEPDDFMC